MKLLTPQLIKRFKEVGDQLESKNPLVIAKFFDPVGSATWYATQYNPQTNICYGYVMGLVADPQGRFDEWGPFLVDELESIRRPFGLTIERDIHFSETPFDEIFKKQRLQELKQKDHSKDKNEDLER